MRVERPVGRGVSTYVGGATGDRVTALSGLGGNALELFWSTTQVGYHNILIINIA